MLLEKASISQDSDPQLVTGRAPSASAVSTAGSDVSHLRARTAIDLIQSRGLPADPRNFELWYGYVEGLTPGLNDAMDQAFGGGRMPRAADIESIHSRFMPAGRMLTEVAGLGDELSRQASQVNDIIAKAKGASATCRHHLDLIDKELSTEDAATVTAMISLVKQVSTKFDSKNIELEAMLQDAKNEIAELQRSLHVVRAESLTDGLTNLPNRKAFDQELERAIARAGAGATLSLIVLDVDHFKRFNDSFGHTTGDQVLRLIGHILQVDVRQGDHPARYGGEEFAIILPDTPLKAAMATAEKIRRAISMKELVRRGSGDVLGKVTVSLGIAEFRNGETAEAFVHRADIGLYKAKSLGRNQAVAA
jgi:diguanylate cyclase